MRKIKLIAGPCSAESQKQLLDTVQGLLSYKEELSDAGFELEAFRAGAWKPRTRPGCFEGVGAAALEWFADVQNSTGLPGIVEVAKPEHVEEALKAGVRMVWIGTRTTTNPFDTQDIADALRGVDIPVFVKNPINPDVDLWAGAIERFRHVGITKVAAIHRGFSFYEKCKYRNYPKWQVPIELMQRMPEVPMYGDASHISGKREYIPELVQKALDLGFKGLFIESHINPSVALSDSAQQLTPSDLASILKGCSIKELSTESSALQRELQRQRARIDIVDENILDVLSDRMRIVEELGALKKDNNMTVLQQARWEQIQQLVRDGAAARGLDLQFVEELFRLIHQAAIDNQSR